MHPKPTQHNSQSGHMMHTNAQLQILNETPFDRYERTVLHISRLFFLSFHLPETAAWVNAFQLAQDEFAAPFGPSIAKAVLDVITVTRTLRGSGFEYCDPRCHECCAFITKEERYLISALHYTRRHERQKARMQSMMLCEGAEDSSFFSKISQLSHISDTPEFDIQ